MNNIKTTRLIHQTDPDRLLLLLEIENILSENFSVSYQYFCLDIFWSLYDVYD
jgi:hypothetical protein